MKVAPDDFTQVTQVCVTYSDPSDGLSTLRVSDPHYSALHTSSSLEPEIVPQSKWVLSATSTVKLRWDLAVILMSLYSALIVPLELGFQLDQYEAVKVVDYCVNVLFILDIVVNFRSSYLNELNDEVKDTWRIAKRYLKGAFAFDLLACLPLDIILSLTTPDINPSTIRVLAMVKLIRLIRLRHIIYFLRANKNFKLSLQLFLIICSALLFCHVVACLWFAVISIDQEWLPPNHRSTHMHLYTEMSAAEKYITSFYYAMLLKGGFDAVPVTTMEMAFASGIVFCGGVFTAIVLGYMTVTLDGLNKNSSAFIDSVESMQQVMLDLKLPALVQSHVTAYMHYTRNSRDMQRTLSAFLEVLPKPLRLQVTRRLVSTAIGQHPLFGLRERAVQYLEQQVAIQSYEPEATLFALGSEATHFYVICSGEVLITTRTVAGIAATTRVLKKGLVFGEIGLLMKCRRTGTAATKNFSTIGSVTKAQFEEMLDEESTLKAELMIVARFYLDEWRKFVVKTLRYLPYLRFCSDEDLVDLSFQVSETQFEATQPVLERGQPTESVFIVASGCLSGWLKANGTLVCVLKLHQGDIAGVYSVLQSSPLPLALTAETQSLIVQVPKSSLTRTVHAGLARKNAQVRTAIADAQEHLGEMFEKTGDFQVRALASL